MGRRISPDGSKSKLSDALDTVSQRTAGVADSLATSRDRVRFVSAVKKDFSNIINQINNVYVPLMQDLDDEILMRGFDGTAVTTDRSASSSSAAAFYSAQLGRALTIKETIDIILGELSRVESTSGGNTATVTSSVDSAQLDLDTANIEQLRKDVGGVDYTLPGDGEAALVYPLAQHIDALGAFFNNFPGTGLTFENVYPTITLAVLLSQVVLDTTIAQSTVTGLTADLLAIQDFTGMNSATDASPEYSAHGAIVYVSDGDSLELAVQELDAQLASIVSLTTTGVTPDDYTLANITVDAYGRITAAANGSGVSSPLATVANVTSNSPGTLASDDFVFGSDTLDDAGTSAHDNRFFFDKSKGTFYAGAAQSTQWDDTNRSSYTVVFGLNNQIDGTSTGSSILGGQTNQITAGSISAVITSGSSNVIDSSNSSSIGGGLSNTITASLGAGIVAGYQNSIGAGAAASYSFVGGGRLNKIGDSATSSYSAVVGGYANDVEGSYSAAVGGLNNAVTSDYSVVSGESNTISTGTHSAVHGGKSSTISSSANNNAVIGGTYSKIDTAAANSVIIGGGNTSKTGNRVSSSRSVVLGGYNNVIDSSSVDSIAAGGTGNIVDGESTCAILGAKDSEISGTDGDNRATNTVIVGGDSHSITSTTAAVIGSGIFGGLSNSINGAHYGTILGGSNNLMDISVGATSMSYCLILGGEGNKISEVADYGIAMGHNAWSYMAGQKTLGGGSFISDTTAGQAQSSDIILHAEDWTSGPVILTTDGAVADTDAYANVLHLNPDRAVFATAHWVIMDSSTGITKAVGGTTSALITRYGTDTVIVADYDQGEMTNASGTHNKQSIVAGNMTASGLFVAVGSDDDSAVYFEITSNSVSATTRAVARITWTELYNKAY